jgi:CRISPR-associated protein Cas1
VEDISPSSLKSILHSKRANLYYLEYCRVQVNGGRVEYVTEQERRSAYWNIPIANTTCILLGNGTSVTQAAMRELGKAGVVVGFCGGGGSPLFAGCEVMWQLPQSEYRPTEYLQQWVSFWFDDEKRLAAAYKFQQTRVFQIKKQWKKLADRERQFSVDLTALDSALKRFNGALPAARSQGDVLALEARLTKSLYKFAVNAVGYGEFTRAKDGSGVDTANQFLDHGNYLAYGLGATAAWVLGLPHALPVLHGKTRRGALVFDIADLVKDALVLPQAFISAAQGDDDREFRMHCMDRLRDADALDTMIDTLKETAAELAV